MPIQCTAINATNTTIYTSLGNNAITTLVVANVNAYNAGTPTVGTSNLNLYIVPSGSTTNFVNMITNAIPVTAGETFTFDNEKIVMGNGDQLVASASAANGIAVSAISVTVVSFSAKTGSGPYLVTFNLPSTASLATNAGVGFYFSVAGNGNSAYNGVFACTASSATTIQLSYNSDPGVYGAGTTTLNSSALVATVSTLAV